MVVVDGNDCDGDDNGSNNSDNADVIVNAVVFIIGGSGDWYGNKADTVVAVVIVGFALLFLLVHCEVKGLEVMGLQWRCKRSKL